MTEVLEGDTLKRWQREPIRFIEEVLRNPKTNRPFELFPAQREFFKHAWTIGADGRLLYPEQCFGAIKKTGKTATAAMHGLVTTLVFGGRYAEAYCISNDLEQAQGRVFTAIKQICESSPLLRRECVITQSRITFPQTHAFIQAIGADYASAAGAHPTFVSADELWGFESESSRRFFDECVPVPTQRISVRLVTSHAGFEDGSDLLFEMYQRGIALPGIGPDLHAGDGSLFYWSCTPQAPWQTDEWLTQMRRSLRPAQYLRMIENRFVSSESTFIEPAAWDACVNVDWVPPLANTKLPVHVGVDASHKHDSSAIVVVHFDDQAQRVRLVFHRIYQPRPDDPLDFEETIERCLLDLRKRYQIVKILFDPWQLQASAQRLAKQGLPIREFPQSTPNLTAASNQLFDLIRNKGLTLYADPAMRLAATRCIAVEGSRGWRIAKEKQSHKIDVIVALAQACYAAVHQPRVEPVKLVPAFVSGVPSSIPGGSVYADGSRGGFAGVSPHSPHRPSITRDWYRYAGVSGVRHDRWNPGW